MNLRKTKGWEAKKGLIGKFSGGCVLKAKADGWPCWCSTEFGDSNGADKIQVVGLNYQKQGGHNYHLGKVKVAARSPDPAGAMKMISTM